MVNGITVDSSVIVASLISTEIHHIEAKQIWSEIVLEKSVAVLPYTVLVEVVGAIRRRTNSFEKALKAKRQLLDEKNIFFIEIEENVANGAATLSAEIGLRGMDSLLVYVAKEYGTELKTFDEEMLAKWKLIR